MIMPKSLGVLCKISKHCVVIRTSAVTRHDDVGGVINEELDRARRLPKFCSNDNSTVSASRVEAVMFGIPVEVRSQGSAVLSIDLASYFQLLDKFL